MCLNEDILADHERTTYTGTNSLSPDNAVRSLSYVGTQINSLVSGSGIGLLAEDHVASVLRLWAIHDNRLASQTIAVGEGTVVVGRDDARASESTFSTHKIRCLNKRQSRQQGPLFPKKEINSCVFNF